MQEPDLSFTHDEDWKQRRQAVWKPLELSLKSDYRKKELKVIERYMMTGERTVGDEFSDSSLLTYYPLMSSEGWDYVYEHLVREPYQFNTEFYNSVQTSDSTFVSKEEKLRYFDYYHGPEYKPVIKSRVPIRGEVQEFSVDPFKLAGFMTATISQFLSGRYFAASLHRQDYYFSVLAQVVEIEDSTEIDRVIGLLTRIFGGLLDLPSKGKNYLNDNLKDPLIQEFRDKLDSCELSAPIQRLWQEAKLMAAIQKDPHQIEFYLALDKLLRPSKQWIPIIKYWNKFLVIHPDNSRAHFELSAAYRDKKINKMSIQHLKKAADLGYKEAIEMAKNLGVF